MPFGDRQTETLDGRAVPGDEHAEMALLSALMVRRDQAPAYELIADWLRGEHFQVRLFGRIYETIGRLVDRRAEASPLTIAAEMEGDEDLTAEGGIQYLIRIGTTGGWDVEAYAEHIRGLAHRRSLMALGEDMVRFAQHPEGDATIEQAAVAFETRLGALGNVVDAARQAELVSLGAAAAVARLRANLAGTGLVGLTTGISDLDGITGGLHPTDLVVIGGRPAQGKTALGTTIAHAAAADGARVAFFSMEMSREQLGGRVMAEITGVSAKRQRLGRSAMPPIDMVEIEDLDRAAVSIERLPLYIDDTPALTIAALTSRANRLARRLKGLDLIVVDYLQLMTGDPARPDQNRVGQLSDITAGLKALAKRLEIPILCLSQLNRGVEGRDDKRPTPADLRDSGSIEQDADAIWFTYREEEYRRREEPRLKPGGDAKAHAAKMADWHTDMGKLRGVGEILIEKNRHGENTSLRCHFNGERTCWGNLARGY